MAKKKKTHAEKGCEKSKTKGAVVSNKNDAIDCKRCIDVLSKISKNTEKKAKELSGIMAHDIDSKSDTLIPIEKLPKNKIIEVVVDCHRELFAQKELIIKKTNDIASLKSKSETDSFEKDSKIKALEVVCDSNSETIKRLRILNKISTILIILSLFTWFIK